MEEDYVSMQMEVVIKGNFLMGNLTDLEYEDG
jgi:hypothetical protein